MKYTLKGHDRETAVCDMLISLLPDEKHESGGDDCVSSLEIRGKSYYSYAEIKRNGEVYKGECVVPMPDGAENKKRATSYCVKTALYHALSEFLPEKAPWGSLTGVKPAKPVRLYLQEHTAQEAEKWLTERYFTDEDRAKLCVKAAMHAYNIEHSLHPREIQLYIGIPFCPTKCAYCSFVSNDVKRWGHLIEPYYNALLSEIAAFSQTAAREKLEIGSVYIGGGTPTTLTAKQLRGLINALRDGGLLEKCREFTVEAGRPDTIDEEKLTVLSENGVSRISINPQSMRDDVLKACARPHTAEDVEKAYALARKTGDFIINMDLIAGLPGDDGEGLKRSVARLIELAPENITIHCLARKKGAPLRFGETGDLRKEELDSCYELLEKAGYEPYYLYRQKYSAGRLENVGFCKNGLISKYNICMMEEIGSTAALGAGGITKICTENDAKITRICNPKYPLEYIERIDAINEIKSKINM